MDHQENRPEPEPEPRIIGLTGGIGSGKTTVAKIIETMGYPVYYSDTRAKTIVNDSDSLREGITNLLGSQAYDELGAYNRKYVAAKVFENEELLLQLNALIHPAVRTDFENWVRLQTTAFVFKETALLFELELDKSCYKTLLVTADDNFRIKRVMDRDGKTYREVEAIMNRQMPEKEKIRRADFVILNNGSPEDLEEETKKILSEIVVF